MTERSGVTRRKMLGAASVVPFSAVRGTAANSAVTVGLIGCGNRGTYLGQLVTEHTTARLTALCDIYPEAIARARQKIGRTEFAVFQDMDKLLASPVDAVLVATPVFLHPPHFEAAVQAGKHVYQEKPAAPDVAGSLRIERAAAKVTGRDLCFGFQRRYGHVYTEARKFFDSGKIGKINMISGRFIKSWSGENMLKAIPTPRTLDEKIKTWGHWRELSGDLIVENNCHVIDVMNWFAGARPESANGEGSRTRRVTGDIRDCNNVIYQYPNRVHGTLCGMTLAPRFHRDVREEFFGSDGYLETSELGWRYRLSPQEAHEEKSPRNIAIDSIQAFARRIQTGKTENTIASGVESSLTSILGRLAMDLRRPVSWKEMLDLNGWPRG